MKLRDDDNGRFPTGRQEENAEDEVKTSDPTEREIRIWTGADIEAEAPKQVDWVVRPWVALGAITEVDGKAKVAGKTTWQLHMAAAVINGGPFMGEPTLKGPVVYLTEQSIDTFRVVLQNAGLLGNRDLHVIFWHETLGIKWRTIVKAATAKCRKVKAKVLIVDTLPQFARMAGDDENNAGDALKAMRPLQLAAHQWHLAVIISRHERKSGGDVGDSARGSSAFAGAVDLILSLRRPEGKSRPTLREIHSLSRFSETPPRLTIELTKRGYISHGSISAVAAREAETAILAAAPRKKKRALTREELLKAAGVTAHTTGRRAIAKLQKRGPLLRTGSGKKGDPYRFWIKAVD